MEWFIKEPVETFEVFSQMKKSLMWFQFPRYETQAAQFFLVINVVHFGSMLWPNTKLFTIQLRSSRVNEVQTPADWWVVTASKFRIFIKIGWALHVFSSHDKSANQTSKQHPMQLRASLVCFVERGVINQLLRCWNLDLHRLMLFKQKLGSSQVLIYTLKCNFIPEASWEWTHHMNSPGLKSNRILGDNTYLSY